MRCCVTGVTLLPAAKYQIRASRKREMGTSLPPLLWDTSTRRSHSVQITSPRVVRKSCLIHRFLSPLLHEQIQIHRRYSILEKTCSCNRIKLNYQATKKKIESTRKHRRLGSKFCDRLPTSMARARKQRKYINRHINIIKIRGKKTRHLPYSNCPLILPTKHVAWQTDFVVLVSLYCAEPLSNLNLKHNF